MAVVKVQFSDKAASDLATIRDHLKFYTGDAKKAQARIKALIAAAKRLGETAQVRLGEELDGFEGHPLREIHKNVVLGGAYEHYYEIIPAYSEQPRTIAILRVWDTRQDR